MTTTPESEPAKLAVDGQSQLLADGNLASLARYEYSQNVYPKSFIRCVEKAVNYYDLNLSQILFSYSILS